MNTKFAIPFKFLVIVVFLNICNAQRVVPGVNPQHYQQVPVQQQQQYQQQHPPPQQYQQQQQQQQQVHHAPGVAPQHYQQQNVQYQQVPVQQQQQQQVPVQQQHQQAHPPAPQVQQPVHQGQQQQQQHHGHHPPQQVLNAANIEHERAHIQEHMQVPIDTSKMSEAELQFHYFKMHDSDNNNKLDGCELIKSLIHWHEQGSKEQHTDAQKPHIEEKIFSDEELVALIDPILQMDDTSRDGYIDYPEFIKAQQKAASKQQQQQQQQQQQN